MAATVRHFLDLDALPAVELRRILDHAHAMKKARGQRPRGAADDGRILAGQMLALIFEKPSTRTRISFDLAMRQLGGETMVLQGQELQFGHGETIADTARVLSRYADVMMLRTRCHAHLLELADAASVPVINGLTDLTHPCQLMADVMTFEEKRGPIAGRTVAWTGAGNNVCASWIHAAVRFGFALRIATPQILRPRRELVDWAAAQGGRVTLHGDPREAVENADIVVTDTWIQMSEADALGEGGSRTRHNLLMPFRVDDRLMAAAAKDALFMHCLPAHRGEEVTDSVLDGPQSVVFDGAENRLHAQKAVLAWCLSS